MKKEKIKEKVDLSKQGEIFFAVSELVNAEDHLMESFKRLKHENILKFHHAIREIRTALLKKIANPEFWCESKHIAAGYKHIIEACYKSEHQAESKELIKLADDLLRIFWALQEEENEKVSGK